MAETTALDIAIEYDPLRLVGRLRRETTEANSTVWERLTAKAASNPSARTTDSTIELPWPDLLGVVREFGSSTLQRSLNYRFRPKGEAVDRLRRFVEDTKAAQSSKSQLTVSLTPGEIAERLEQLGFIRRLRDFQLRDLSHLLALPHGANFSVPGAGKTTVTLALHLLVARPEDHLLVIGPKAAFPAWKAVVNECMAPDAAMGRSEQFTILDGSETQNDILLRSGRKRFLMSYDLLVRQQSLLANYLARTPVHLVLDESHRMKAGGASQRGAFLISVAALPRRRDILSGTPMPQDANDMASQLKFLWPGAGFDLRIERGATPRDVLGSLYVRTTKDELGLPEARRFFHDVDMLEGQKALYGVVKNEILRQLTSAVRRKEPDFLSARKSVMRLLQLSANPTLALYAMSRERQEIDSGIAGKVVEEGPSSKMREVSAHARRLAHQGRKVVVWTIFTQTILDLELLLSDLNPVSLFGAVPTGETFDPNTREGRLARFHEDDNCMAMIANPAAAGEGISLHHVCHDAIYLDRSYVSTHYLQSIDRIHRLGLPPDVETNIHIYRTSAPAILGSVDMSVSRRLAQKIRNLQDLLDDQDLHKLALDEEVADDPLDYDVEMQDLIDLVEELEGKRHDQDEEA